MTENRRGQVAPRADHGPSPSKRNPWLLHPVLRLSFQPVTAKHLSGLMGSCRPPDRGPLCQPSPSLLLASLPFHLYPFCTSLVLMLPFPSTPYSPHAFPQQNKLTFSPIDLLSLSIKCAEQARHTEFFLLGSHGA